MNARDLTLEEISRNREPYLRMVYALCGINSLFYILKFNFDFRVSQFNHILIPLWIMMIVLPPLIVKLWNNYRWASIAVCSTTTPLTLYLIYVSGGLSAPGLFWIAAIPLALGMLFGNGGAVTGYAIVLSTLAFFTYSHLEGNGPNIISEHANYHVEIVINLIGFIAFCSFTARAYHKRELRYSEELLQKSNNVESLLRVLLHDIANTLSSMTYNLIRIKEGGQEGGTPGELEKIEKAIEDIHTLLFQVRHLKSIKDGKSQMPLRPISLPMVLHEVYELTEATAQQKGVKLNWELPREKINVRGDKTILSNVVLLNVVNNAIKFSHPFGRIDVISYREDLFAVIEVRDFGIGMPAEILNNIFSLSYTTSRSGTAGEKGTGYGMPLAKEYLQLMGGEIDVTSSEVEQGSQRAGTLVKIKLPLALSETSELSETHLSPIQNSPSEISLEDKRD